ncbi:nuclear RNA export factor 1-like [Tenrec ecaudatus]|uniref:nuclear RNA export factor 1-like n=1 Tax=Tenrec ecaudatus TaxID=94439 RepID=UPI003F5A9D04
MADWYWLLNLSESQTNVPFTLVQGDKQGPPFDIASVVPQDLSKEMESENTKMFEGVPTPEVKGDESCQGAHDLPQKFHSDTGVMLHGTEMRLNGRKDTASSLQIHQENMPKILPYTLSNTSPSQLVGLPNVGKKDPTMQSRNLLENQMKAEEEMDTGKGLEPEEMSARRKPLCTISPDKHSNMRQALILSFALTLNSNLLDLFSKFLSLDDQEFPSPDSSGIGDEKKLAARKVRVFESDALKDLVWKFLKQYYSIYDNGDRQCLLSVYHDNACFSLTTLFNPGGQPIVRLANYFMDNRNLKELKEIGPCVQLLKQTKKEVVDFLCVLPRTEHDLSSFVVDTCIHRLSEAPPFSSIFIINDQMTVTEVRPKDSQSDYINSIPTASSSFVPSTAQVQQEARQATSTRYGMSLLRSQK